MEGLMSRIIFSDFDGTITTVDTCWAMVTAFASDGWEKINRLWEEKKLSTEECANATFALFDANPGDLQKLLKTIEIDPDFPEFARLAQNHGDRLVVLSDGYDMNIRTIFNKYAIDLPYYSNKLRYNGRFQIECTYKNQACGICGTCKTSLLERLKKDGDEVVYIGDGNSDFCAAKHADRVFAKGSLLKHCAENGIKVTPFQHFGDIIRAMDYK
jgi:2-hydroxy-3-keto-5-methylthiopentenyl-1-phosphate phosphatase